MVVEILERQDVSDADAAAFLFKDLAERNDSAENEFEPKDIPAGTNPMNCSLCAGVGIQQVAIGLLQETLGRRKCDWAK